MSNISLPPPSPWPALGPRPGSANRLPPLHSMAVDQSARVLNASDPLVSAAPPPLDMSKLQDVLLHFESQINYLIQSFAPENFDVRVNQLIDAKVVPALTKRDQEFEKFNESIFGTRKECLVSRITKNAVDISVTRDSLEAERTERKKRHGELAARLLRAETAVSEKADQSEVDALLRSVITTMGNVGQRMGENEAQVATIKVAQQQMDNQIGSMTTDISDLMARPVVDPNKLQTDLSTLQAEIQDCTNRVQQLDTKVETWKADGGVNLMDAMWRRSREERVQSLINEPVEVLRERETISLDDTVLQLSDWERLLDKLARCRGDQHSLKLKRLSLHSCQLPARAAQQFGLVLAYSCPRLEFLSLKNNSSLGYQGWNLLFEKVAAGGGMPKLNTLNLQQCGIPEICNNRLEIMFRACPELESVECSDEWIDELWQRLDSPRPTPARPSTPDKEAATVAARVSAASALAEATAGAFAAALPGGRSSNDVKADAETEVVRPVAAGLMVGAQDIFTGSDGTPLKPALVETIIEQAE